MEVVAWQSNLLVTVFFEIQNHESSEIVCIEKNTSGHGFSPWGHEYRAASRVAPRIETGGRISDEKANPDWTFTFALLGV
jgi:hypothetical protein